MSNKNHTVIQKGKIVKMTDKEFIRDLSEYIASDKKTIDQLEKAIADNNNTIKHLVKQQAEVEALHQSRYSMINDIANELRYKQPTFCNKIKRVIEWNKIPVVKENEKRQHELIRIHAEIITRIAEIQRTYNLGDNINTITNILLTSTLHDVNCIRNYFIVENSLGYSTLDDYLNFPVGSYK